MNIESLSKEELKNLCGELSAQISILKSQIQDLNRELEVSSIETERFYMTMMMWVVENESGVPHALFEHAINEIENYIYGYSRDSKIDDIVIKGKRNNEVS